LTGRIAIKNIPADTLLSFDLLDEF